MWIGDFCVLCEQIFEIGTELFFLLGINVYDFHEVVDKSLLITFSFLFSVCPYYTLFKTILWCACCMYEIMVIFVIPLCSTLHLFLRCFFALYFFVVSVSWRKFILLWNKFLQEKSLPVFPRGTYFCISLENLHK